MNYEEQHVEVHGVDDAELTREAIPIVRAIMRGGGVLPDEEVPLVLKRMKGAMTNKVYECGWKGNEGESAKVLVRIYGDGADYLFKREDEMATFEMMSHGGHGPKLLGRFSNGRVEEFLHARTLSASDLRDPKIATRIATKLREFHGLAGTSVDDLRPQLWERLRRWMGRAMEVVTPLEMEEFKLGKLGEELSSLETLFGQAASGGKREIGFCHNDLQYGNIMLDEVDGSITLIDYEYACINYVSFDIGNYFCEMAANYHSDQPHIVDFEHRYPTLEERQDFVESYLRAEEGSARLVANRKEVEELAEEAHRFTLLSHIHWGLWAIVCAASPSAGDFDYLAYAKLRINYYFKMKGLLLLGGAPVLSV